MCECTCFCERWVRVVPVCIHKTKRVHICTNNKIKACAFVFLHVCSRDGGPVFGGKSRRLCVWLHLGADDSLGGSLNVGRQTKECRSVILGEILYYAAVVLGNKQRHMQVTHTHVAMVVMQHSILAFPSNTCTYIEWTELKECLWSTIMLLTLIPAGHLPIWSKCLGGWSEVERSAFLLCSFSGQLTWRMRGVVWRKTAPGRSVICGGRRGCRCVHHRWRSPKGHGQIPTGNVYHLV